MRRGLPLEKYEIQNTRFGVVTDYGFKVTVEHDQLAIQRPIHDAVCSNCIRIVCNL